MWMKVLFLLLLCLSQGVWAADPCTAHARRIERETTEHPVSCYCGPSLSRVRAQLPGSLRVEAACQMRRNRGLGKSSPLRPGVDVLDLDRYDADGSYIEGWVFLRGQLEIEGQVMFTDEGASFSARQLYREDGGPSVLANNYLYSLVQLSEAQSKLLKPPRARSGDPACKIRTARLRFTDFEIYRFDTGGDGSRPGRVEVLSLGPLKSCVD
ncbi:MAG: hypothetical protein ACOVPA_05475 [Rubrivivax sp.]